MSVLTPTNSGGGGFVDDFCLFVCLFVRYKATLHFSFSLISKLTKSTNLLS